MKLIHKDTALILTTALSTTTALTWLHVLVFFDGQACMNCVGEGWYEFAIFSAVAVYGIITVTYLHRSV